MGGGVGKIFNIGKQSVSLSAQGFSNVIKPRTSPHTTAIVLRSQDSALYFVEPPLSVS